MSVVYKAVVSAADKVVPRGLRPLWEHPAASVVGLATTFLIFKLSTVSMNNLNWAPHEVCNQLYFGPKTIFFWAPAFKWGLVIAGIGDITRPAEKLSVSQCSALAATGMVWSRYSLVIIPKNWSLFSVNVFVAATNTYQLVRAYMYQQEQKKALENSNEK